MKIRLFLANSLCDFSTTTTPQPSSGPSTSDDAFKRLTQATESSAFARPILITRSPRSAALPSPAQESQPAVDPLCSAATLRLRWHTPAAPRRQAGVSCSTQDPQSLESDTRLL